MSEARSCDSDKATDFEEKWNSLNLQAQLNRAKPDQKQLPDGSYAITECVDCDEPLNAARLNVGSIRCVHCQTAKEKKHG